MNFVNASPEADAANRAAGGSHAFEKATPGDEQIAARILADVTAYVPHLRERALETEKLGRIPDATIRDLDAIGVFKMCIPVEYGGYASTPMQQHAVIAEVARGCGSTGWVTWVTLTGTQWVGLYDRRFQNEVFAADWVGPLTCGAGNPCVARRVPGGLMLKGSWPFCSGSQHTAFVHVGAVCMDGDDSELYLAHVPRGQIRILDDWKVMGMRGTSSNTVVIEDEVFVPDYRARTVHDIFSTNRIEPAHEGLLYQLDIVSLTASLHSAVALGIARAAVELFKEKIHTRKITHLRYDKQSEAPITHIQLGELHCKLLAAELISRNNVAEAEKLAQKGRTAEELDLKRTTLESSYVMKIASEITELTLRASGASSIRETSPFQRLFRDSRVATLHAHTMIETCLEEFGRAALGMPTATTFNTNSLPT